MVLQHAPCLAGGRRRKQGNCWLQHELLTLSACNPQVVRKLGMLHVQQDLMSIAAVCKSHPDALVDNVVADKESPFSSFGHVTVPRADGDADGVPSGLQPC